MTLKKTSLMVCGALAYMTAIAQHKPLPSSARPSTTEALTRNLTSDSWVKDLGAKGQPDQYHYAFSKNGSYTSKHVTDVNTEPRVGRWRVTKEKDGKTHLVLINKPANNSANKQAANKQQEYYWLQQDSIIRYDKNKDVMLISGENYVGVQQLRRKKS